MPRYYYRIRRKSGYSNELRHYGVKGMKWGNRNGQYKEELDPYYNETESGRRIYNALHPTPVTAGYLEPAAENAKKSQAFIKAQLALKGAMLQAEWAKDTPRYKIDSFFFKVSKTLNESVSKMTKRVGNAVNKGKSFVERKVTEAVNKGKAHVRRKVVEALIKHL